MQTRMATATALVAVRPGAWALVFAAASLLVACKATVEDRGPLLAQDATRTAPNMLWTTDGSEVVYVALAQGSGAQTLKAVRVADGATRQLDGAAPATYLPLARPANGSALYELTSDKMLRDAIAGKNIAPAQPFGSTALATSLDGRLILYWDVGVSASGTEGPGAAVLVDAGQDTATPLGFCAPTWFVFSPSGNEALCTDRTTGAFDIFDLVTKTIREQHSALVSPQSVRWGSNGLQLAGALAGDEGAIAVNDLVAGTARVVYRLPPPSSSAVKTKDFPGGNAVSGATLAADGQQLALWEAECLGKNFAEPEYCGTAQGLLVLINLDTRSQRVVASGEATFDGGGGSGPIAFSDDGAQIAYRIGSEIHVRPGRP